MITKSLFDRCFRVQSIAWQRVLKDSRVMMGFLKRILIITQDGLTKETCIAASLYARKVIRLVRKSGYLFTALYLKQCNTCLMMAYGGVKSPHTLLPTPIALTRSGYPTIIPSFHRKMILKKDDKADRLVRMYLSFFSLYRMIIMGKKITGSLTRPIWETPKQPISLEYFARDLNVKAKILLERYVPWVSTIPFNQGVEWVPTWKSIPTSKVTSEFFRFIGKGLGLPKRWSSIFSSIGFEMKDFEAIMYENLPHMQILGGNYTDGDQDYLTPQYSLYIAELWPALVRYAFDKKNEYFSEWCYHQSGKGQLPSLSGYLPEVAHCYDIIMGRLGMKVEGGGKRRLFAIGNYVIQRMLHPLHQWLMEVLRPIPMDGTFNQTAPLDRLVGAKECYSFDLTAATDRWPVRILEILLAILFDKELSKVVLGSLTSSFFQLPYGKRNVGGSSVYPLKFCTGQPLGYYSSWPLFALSHHLVIWFCADKVYPGKVFDRYAVLGDDVVITDKQVADLYERTMFQIGVAISKQKSLVSDSGAAEFAKRFKVKGLSKDLSPVSCKALSNFFNPFGLVAIAVKYNVSKLSSLVRLGGGGYRVLGSLHQTKTVSKFVRRLMSMQRKHLFQSAHLELWLGQGCPLSPYLKYFLWNYLIDKLIPKDLELMPVELSISDDFIYLQEKTVIHGWVRQWLKLLQWYWRIKDQPDTSLGALFDAPYCTSSWRRTSLDPEWVRFGYLWKMYDMVTQMGVGYLGGILDSKVTLNGYLLGGSAGTSFLIRALGVIQPKARSGIIVPGVIINYNSRNDPRNTTIHYKTLGVSDRQVVLDFDRSVQRKKTGVLKKLSVKAGGSLVRTRKVP